MKADTSEVYIGLWEGSQEVVSKTWEAGRELSVQILREIESLCSEAETSLQNLNGTVAYEGPGSYTGLRISISVANTIGYAHSVPVVGVTGAEWIMQGQKKLEDVKEFAAITPIYGGEVYTTKPKK